MYYMAYLYLAGQNSGIVRFVVNTSHPIDSFRLSTHELSRAALGRIATATDLMRSINPIYKRRKHQVLRSATAHVSIVGDSCENTECTSGPRRRLQQGHQSRFMVEELENIQTNAFLRFQDHYLTDCYCCKQIVRGQLQAAT